MNASVLSIFLMYSLGISAFAPDRNRYDKYGIKIAINEIFFVQVQNQDDPPMFLVQFAPYEGSSLQCLITLPNGTNHYIYSVTMGKSQLQFFFAGELINTKNGTFIGVAKYNASSSSCVTQFTFTIQYFYNYEHQEYYVIGVEPSGRYAYGFANKFIFIFDSFNISLNVWNGNETWPDHSFIPHAIDITNNFSVIAGFIRNSVDAIAVYIPVIYLINFSSSTTAPIFVDNFKPTANPNTWQNLLTNSNADTYLPKYDMSVSINDHGDVLVGMQFVNRVFLFSIEQANPTKLILTSRYTGGRSLGNGKSVAWLDAGVAAILFNTYSLEYQWISSEIHFYDIKNDGYESTSTPLSIFPNNHQILPLRFGLIFLNIISSPSSLALLDDQGNILIMNPTPSGYFPAVRDSGSMPVFTSAQLCFPGTYKNRSGIQDCSICPSGTKNGGNSSIQCVACAANSFCPLGSVSDIPLSALETITQVVTYPKSPESTQFEDVLIQNTFFINTCHKLYASPVFWWLIVFSLGCLALGILMCSGKVSRAYSLDKQREPVKYWLKNIDLIHEGESMIGGLGTVALLVAIIVITCFGILFLQQYPIETASTSSFACDASIRNAKFETNLQLLSIPVSNDEQQMFDLLDKQSFILNIQFINTLINCDAISIKGLYGSAWTTIRWLTCGNTDGILTLSMQLPHQQITIQVSAEDVKTVGALRIGLYANGSETDQYDLKELNFYQSFFKYGQVLSQSLPITLDITKIINETLPIRNEKTVYSGIFIPTFNVDLNGLFLSNDQHVRLMLQSTILTIAIVETPYYVKNTQLPIVKLSEVAFDSFLFVLGFLEICTIVLMILALPFKATRRVYFVSFFKKSFQRLSTLLERRKLQTNKNIELLTISSNE
ncbi:unnamed protein product [Adineta ricciae]|uniref:Tyrosine-protein kinase ephrin type A/B receptor-like domain-containing protein n=1 Tax=Adineta ricciae TaxID=249248 RepID=A0A813NXK4_ADIRI|nr:unnamed protein product [Adineta ricciae]CAF1136539.1 unnamed protein product [Adineta ricciae]